MIHQFYQDKSLTQQDRMPQIKPACAVRPLQIIQNAAAHLVHEIARITHTV